MAKKQITTVAVHARIPVVDIEEVDRAAEDELVSRSNMIARIVREWAKARKASEQQPKGRKR